MGCPVVAANVPGSDEQLGDAALLVDPSDPKAIASEIRRIVDDEELRSTLAARGKERAARATPESFVTEVVGAIERFWAIRRNWP